MLFIVDLFFVVCCLLDNSSRMVDSGRKVSTEIDFHFCTFYIVLVPTKEVIMVVSTDTSLHVERFRKKLKWKNLFSFS